MKPRVTQSGCCGGITCMTGLPRQLSEMSLNIQSYFGLWLQTTTRLAWAAKGLNVNCNSSRSLDSLEFFPSYLLWIVVHKIQRGSPRFVVMKRL
ncbi:hypothetical protein AB1N83_007829 [Pleurotus pulmonarius]